MLNVVVPPDPPVVPVEPPELPLPQFVKPSSRADATTTRKREGAHLHRSVRTLYRDMSGPSREMSLLEADTNPTCLSADRSVQTIAVQANKELLLAISKSEE
jgi:hypothetical protein